mmetsp:Transcript_9099/g.13642  ORF Transcript_9099/g.13642 Transcript_9099/m.13642 type:complete len:1249 (+) Transcript_9099:53-3799(+)
MGQANSNNGDILDNIIAEHNGKETSLESGSEIKLVQKSQQKNSTENDNKELAMHRKHETSNDNHRKDDVDSSKKEAKDAKAMQKPKIEAQKVLTKDETKFLPTKHAQRHQKEHTDKDIITRFREMKHIEDHEEKNQDRNSQSEMDKDAYVPYDFYGSPKEVKGDLKLDADENFQIEKRKEKEEEGIYVPVKQYIKKPSLKYTDEEILLRFQEMKHDEDREERDQSTYTHTEHHRNSYSEVYENDDEETDEKIISRFHQLEYEEDFATLGTQSAYPQLTYTKITSKGQAEADANILKRYHIIMKNVEEEKYIFNPEDFKEEKSIGDLNEANGNFLLKTPKVNWKKEKKEEMAPTDEGKSSKDEAKEKAKAIAEEAQEKALEMEEKRNTPKAQDVKKPFAEDNASKEDVQRSGKKKDIQGDENQEDVKENKNKSEKDNDKVVKNKQNFKLIISHVMGGEKSITVEEKSQDEIKTEESSLFLSERRAKSLQKFHSTPSLDKPLEKPQPLNKSSVSTFSLFNAKLKVPQEKIPQHVRTKTTDYKRVILNIKQKIGENYTSRRKEALVREDYPWKSILGEIKEYTDKSDAKIRCGYKDEAGVFRRLLNDVDIIKAWSSFSNEHILAINVKIYVPMEDSKENSKLSEKLKDNMASTKNMNQESKVLMKERENREMNENKSEDKETLEIEEMDEKKDKEKKILEGNESKNKNLIPGESIDENDKKENTLLDQSRESRKEPKKKKRIWNRLANVFGFTRKSKDAVKNKRKTMKNKEEAKKAENEDHVCEREITRNQPVLEREMTKEIIASKPDLLHSTSNDKRKSKEDGSMTEEEKKKKEKKDGNGEKQKIEVKKKEEEEEKKEEIKETEMEEEIQETEKKKVETKPVERNREEIEGKEKKVLRSSQIQVKVNIKEEDGRIKLTRAVAMSTTGFNEKKSGFERKMGDNSQEKKLSGVKIDDLKVSIDARSQQKRSQNNALDVQYLKSDSNYADNEDEDDQYDYGDEDLHNVDLDAFESLRCELDNLGAWPLNTGEYYDLVTENPAEIEELVTQVLDAIKYAHDEEDISKKDKEKLTLAAVGATLRWLSSKPNHKAKLSSRKRYTLLEMVANSANTGYNWMAQMEMIKLAKLSRSGERQLEAHYSLFTRILKDKNSKFVKNVFSRSIRTYMREFITLLREGVSSSYVPTTVEEIEKELGEFIDLSANSPVLAKSKSWWSQRSRNSNKGVKNDSDLNSSGKNSGRNLKPAASAHPLQI